MYSINIRYRFGAGMISLIQNKATELREFRTFHCIK